jgi:hypothetical protein
MVIIFAAVREASFPEIARSFFSIREAATSPEKDCYFTMAL